VLKEKVRFRWIATAAAVAVLLCFVAGLVAPPRAAAKEPKRDNCRVLVVAFVGGLGVARFPPSVTTSLLNEMRSVEPTEVCVRPVSTYFPWSAAPWVQKHLKRHAADVAAGRDEGPEPRIIVIGYSLGVPHALSFARKMDREHVAIEMLVAVDSKGFTNGVIAPNVKTAANYYERELYPMFWPLYYGKKNLRAEDPSRTDFLGNIQIEHEGHFSIVTAHAVRALLSGAVRDAIMEKTPDAATGE